MPVLPLIDLLILLGWTNLLVAFVLKFLSIALAYPLTIFKLSPIDFMLAGGACLLFALTLAARTWVKANEPRLVARRRVASYGLERLPEEGDEAGPNAVVEPAMAPARAGAARRPEAAGGR